MTALVWLALVHLGCACAFVGIVLMERRRRRLPGQRKP